MKKVIKLVLLTIVLMAACNKKTTKQFCTEVSPNCERSKDFVMFKVIENKDFALDVYGRPLQEQKWYLYSTQSRGIIDFEWSDNALSVTPSDLDKLISGGTPSSVLFKCKKFKVSEMGYFDVYFYNVHGDKKKVTKIILFQSEGYFDLFHDGRGTKVTYIMPSNQEELNKGQNFHHPLKQGR